MAKVLVSYGVHPREKGRFAVPFLIPNYKNDPQVKFKRYPYNKTIDYELLSRIREDPGLLASRGTKGGELFEIAVSREEAYREGLARSAAKGGFVTLEVHTWDYGKPMVVYGRPELKPIASRLVEHLKKKGYNGVILASSMLSDKSSIALELPGTAKAGGKAAKQLGSLLKRVGSTVVPAKTQNLEQLRLSKRLLRDTIDFLKTAEVK